MKNSVLLTDMNVLAHSAEFDKDGVRLIEPQTYASHINNVVRFSKEILDSSFIHNFQDIYNEITNFEDLKKIFYQCVLLSSEYHDLGKLDDQCQSILKGEKLYQKMFQHVDAGVALMLKKYNETQNASFVFCALIIYAHHIGLPDFSDNGSTLIDRKLDVCDVVHKFNELFLRDKKSCLEYGLNDVSVLERVNQNLSNYEKLHKQEVKNTFDLSTLLTSQLNSPLFREPIFLKMALSILISADHKDTSENYGEAKLKKYKKLEPQKRIEKIDAYVESLNKNEPKTKRNKLRQQAYEYCKNYKPTSRISLLDPYVGMGKTTGYGRVSMNHALENPHCSQVIVITPYIALNDQIGNVLKESISLDSPETEISIIHSLFDYESKWMRKYSKELNAPISLMTSVGFFDILFKNKVSRIKNLHKLAGSVLVFDEYHTCILDKHWKMVLKMLSDLVKYFNVRIIFSSGTPVKFWDIDQVVNKKSKSYIQDETEDFMTHFDVEKVIPIEFTKSMSDVDNKRVKTVIKGDVSLDQLVSLVNKKSGSIFVVLETIHKCNCFAEAISKKNSKKIFMRHAGLTPQDRLKHIQEMSDIMKNDDVILISTPGGNVGLNLSFRHGFQDNIGLDSFIQTGGRVCRNNEFKGSSLTLFNLIGFNPNPKLFRTKDSLKKHLQKSQILNPEYCTTLKQDEYNEAENKDHSMITNLNLYYDNFVNMQFKTVGKDFRIIENATVQVIIDNDIYQRILKNQYVSFPEIQRNIISISDYDGDKMSYLYSEGKIVVIEEELEQMHGPRDKDAKFSGYGKLCFWKGDYDPKMKGIYADKIFNK